MQKEIATQGPKEHRLLPAIWSYPPSLDVLEFQTLYG